MSIYTESRSRVYIHHIHILCTCLYLLINYGGQYIYTQSHTHLCMYIHHVHMKNFGSRTSTGPFPTPPTAARSASRPCRSTSTPCARVREWMILCMQTDRQTRQTGTRFPHPPPSSSHPLNQPNKTDSPDDQNQHGFPPARAQRQGRYGRIGWGVLGFGKERDGTPAKWVPLECLTPKTLKHLLASESIKVGGYICFG